jgi:hypothetical protein
LLAPNFWCSEHSAGTYGTKVVMHTATLIAQHNEQLQAANAAASERKSRKKKRIQKGATLSQKEAQDLIAEREALVLVEVERREERRAAGGSSRGVPPAASAVSQDIINGPAQKMQLHQAIESI